MPTERQTEDQIRDARFARLLEIFQGDVHATDLIAGCIQVTEVWDDLIDGDREVTRDQVTEAFTLALVEIPSNPLYAKYGAAIRVVLTGAIAAWLDSDKLRDDDVTGAEDLITAHVIRYQILDVALHLLIELHGWRYAREHSTEIRRLFRTETLPEFVEN